VQHACNTGAPTALQWVRWLCLSTMHLVCWRAGDSNVVGFGIGGPTTGPTVLWIQGSLALR